MEEGFSFLSIRQGALQHSIAIKLSNKIPTCQFLDSSTELQSISVVTNSLIETSPSWFASSLYNQRERAGIVNTHCGYCGQRTS